MKLTEKLGLSPEQKEQLLEELLAERTEVNVKSFLRLTSINLRLIRIIKRLSELPAEKLGEALEMILPDLERVGEIVKTGK